VGEDREAQHLVDAVSLLRLQLIQAHGGDARVVAEKSVSVVLQTLYVSCSVLDAQELLLDGFLGALDLGDTRLVTIEV
jgi:hypothetical protein